MIKHLCIILSIAMLFSTLVGWRVFLGFYLEPDSLTKFSIQAKEATCVVKNTTLFNSTCTWRYPGVLTTYGCAKVTVEFQVDGIKAFVTISDSDFPYPLVGTDSNVRMSEHVASDYYNGSSHSCWIRDEDVRFEVENILEFCTLVISSIVFSLTLLCSILAECRKNILSAYLRWVT